MGECGCTADELARFPGPGRTWYIIEVYGGCENCGTDMYIAVLSVEEDSDEYRDFYAEVQQPAITWRGWSEKIIDTEMFKKLFMAEVAETDPLAELPFAMSEFVDRGGLRRVCERTLLAHPEPAPESEGQSG